MRSHPGSVLETVVRSEAERRTTSPSSRNSLKDLLLTLRFGELGKQKKQLVREYKASIAYCASCVMLANDGERKGGQHKRKYAKFNCDGDEMWTMRTPTLTLLSRAVQREARGRSHKPKRESPGQKLSSRCVSLAWHLNRKAPLRRLPYLVTIHMA